MFWQTLHIYTSGRPYMCVTGSRQTDSLTVHFVTATPHREQRTYVTATPCTEQSHIWNSYTTHTHTYTHIHTHTQRTFTHITGWFALNVLLCVV